MKHQNYGIGSLIIVMAPVFIEITVAFTKCSLATLT